MKLEFSPQICEKWSDIKFHERRLVGADLFYADKQIDKTKLIIAFLNHVNAPKKQKVSVQHNT